MSMAAILRRLDAIERRLAIVDEVPDTTAEVLAQLTVIAERRRAMPDWKPHLVSVAVLIEKAAKAKALAA